LLKMLSVWLNLGFEKVLIILQVVALSQGIRSLTWYVDFLIWFLISINSCYLRFSRSYRLKQFKG